MANYLIIAGTNTIGQESAKLLIAQNHKVIITGKYSNRCWIKRP